MVQSLDKRYTGEDYGSSKQADRVLPAQIDPLSKQNFPLCMKSMQDVLSTTHHIKYKVGGLKSDFLTKSAFSSPGCSTASSSRGSD
jgi:hypothetical protein